MTDTIIVKDGRNYALAYRGEIYDGLKFSGREDAEAFMKFVEDRTGLDVSQQSRQRLQELWVIWKGDA